MVIIIIPIHSINNNAQYYIQVIDINYLFQDLSEKEIRGFAKLPAFVKGHLTRQLLHSQRIQDIIKTITVIIIYMLKVEQGVINS